MFGGKRGGVIHDQIGGGPSTWPLAVDLVSPRSAFWVKSRLIAIRIETEAPKLLKRCGAQNATLRNSNQLLT